MRGALRVAVVVALTVGAASSAHAGSSTWVRIDTAAAPAARFGTRMVFDAGSGETVLFGGAVDGVRQHDTWTFSQGEWTLETPDRSPPARTAHAMAYDAARKEVVIFGGGGVTTPWLGDTWTWDGETWAKERPPTSPPARAAARMEFDPLSGRTILFGGTRNEMNFGDTWAWDGATWTRLHPATSPSPRIVHEMVWDPIRAEIVLFGGNAGAAGDSLEDTWVWDGSNWQPRTPADHPSPREGHGMAWDASLGAVVLFGGLHEKFGFYRDTWAWNGRNWVRLHPDRRPPPRGAHAMTSHGGRPLVWGGFAFFSELYRDTWGFDSG